MPARANSIDAPPHLAILEFLRQLVPDPNEKYDALNYPDILDLPVDRILRYERLTEDLISLVPDIELPHLGKTSHGIYSIYYNTESIKLATKIFQPSLEMFNYEFEDPLELLEIRR